MGAFPTWFVNLKKEVETKATMPDWFNDLTAKVDDDPELIARHETKAEGGFAEQLKATIRKHEAPRFGYDSWFGRGTSRGPAAPPKTPTQMTVNEVLDWQNTNNPAGPGTAAIGAYQIVDQPNARTLSGLVRTMGLTGDELFTAELQDRMADTLMRGRGLDKFLAGGMDKDTFANKIAREWASLPVLKPDRRRGRDIAVGQSYYAGDGINKAFKGSKALEEYKNLYALADIGG
jgi:hypothetical protein